MYKKAHKIVNPSYNPRFLNKSFIYRKMTKILLFIMFFITFGAIEGGDKKCFYCNDRLSDNLSDDGLFGGWSCRRCKLVNGTKDDCCRIYQFENLAENRTTENINDTKLKDCKKKCDISLPESSCSMCNKKLLAKLARDNGSTSQIHNCFLVEEKDPMLHTDAYNEIVRNYRDHKRTFVDESFPHATSSIGNLSLIEAENIPIQWLRPDKIATHDNNNGPWTVFNEPQPMGVMQGRLGNCWFIAALAVVAERPELLEQLFVTKEYNASGVYELRLCIDGIWQHILVDDYFPCRAKGHIMLFATGSKKQLWVSLVEKALAKTYGSYTSLTSGQIIEGLATLTGWPVLSIDLKDYRKMDTKDPELDMLWARLIHARKARYLMIGSCKGQTSWWKTQKYRSVGLVTSHTYSILDVRHLSRGQRLLQLRNPWGSKPWLGEYSQDWPGWTPSLRRELSNKVSELPGTFWMPFHRFIEYFDLVAFAEIRAQWGWVTTRYKVDIGWLEGQTVIFNIIRLVITERTELCVTLFQHNARPSKDYVDLMLLLHKQKGINEPGDLIARSPHDLNPFVRTDNIFLDPGEYLLYAHSFAKFGDQQMVPGTVVIHSSKSIRTELVPVSLDNLRASLVALIIKWGKLGNGSDGIITRCLSLDFAGIMVMIDNNNPDFYYQVYSDCRGSKNVLSTRGSLQMVDTIPPLHRQIVTILTRHEQAQDFEADYKSKGPTKNTQLFPLLPRSVSKPKLCKFKHCPAIKGGPLEALHGAYPI